MGIGTLRRHYDDSYEPQVTPEQAEGEVETTDPGQNPPDGSEVQTDPTETQTEGTEPGSGDQTSTDESQESTGESTEGDPEDQTEGSESEEAPEGDPEDAETGEAPTELPPTPARNASKTVWLEFYGITGRDVPENATRDSLAEAVLGPKE